MKVRPSAAALAAAILTVALLNPAAHAQQGAEESWDNLRQLRPGQRIVVADMKLKSHQGTFTGYSAEAISLRTDQQELAIPRANVLSVKNQEGSRRTRNTLIGLAVGAAAGLAVGAAKGANELESGETGLFALVGIPIGAGAGALVGAAMPNGKVTVYRAKSRSGS